MPAWSEPGSHSVGRPRMRATRAITSCRVTNMAWPMCRAPVTLGGGMAMQNGSPVASGSGAKHPRDSPPARTAFPPRRRARSSCSDPRGSEAGVVLSRRVDVGRGGGGDRARAAGGSATGRGARGAAAAAAAIAAAARRRRAREAADSRRRAARVDEPAPRARAPGEAPNARAQRTRGWTRRGRRRSSARDPRVPRVPRGSSARPRSPRGAGSRRANTPSRRPPGVEIKAITRGCARDATSDDGRGDEGTLERGDERARRGGESGAATSVPGAVRSRADVCLDERFGEGLVHVPEGRDDG